MRICLGRSSWGLVVGVVVALAVGLAGWSPGAWAGDPAPAPAAGAAPAPAPAHSHRKAERPWSTYSAENGAYAWAEPSSWIPDEAQSRGGVRMVWNEPGNTGGTFTIAAYAKTGASLVDLVKAASYGGKPRADKAWMCAHGEHGTLKVAVAARVLDSGDFLLLVLAASPPSFKRLGGLPGLRLAANAAYGFKPAAADRLPGE
jgi:hypothetical protein